MKLNIGNPAPWGFEAPEEILRGCHPQPADVAGLLRVQGLYSARKAVMQYCQQLGIAGVEVDDIYIGNGVSELVVMALQGLLDNGDEVLVPAPDYPLWTAAANLCGGAPCTIAATKAGLATRPRRHLRAQITPRTKAIVVINPNNPTGAVYSREVLLEHSRDRPLQRPRGLCRRDLRQDHLRRRAAHSARVSGRRPADRHDERSVEDVSSGRLSHRLDGRQRRQTPRHRLP